MDDTRIPGSPCPDCGLVQDGALGEAGAVPSAGDVSICMKCQGISVFGEGMIRRPPTEAELLEMPLDEISRYQRALSKVLADQ